MCGKRKKGLVDKNECVIDGCKEISRPGREGSQSSSARIVVKLLDCFNSIICAPYSVRVVAFRPPGQGFCLADNWPS